LGCRASVTQHSTSHGEHREHRQENTERTANSIQQTTEDTEGTEELPQGSRSGAEQPPVDPKPLFFCRRSGFVSVSSVSSVVCSSRSLCSLCPLWLVPSRSLCPLWFVLAFLGGSVHPQRPAPALRRSRPGKERCPRGRGSMAGHRASDSFTDRSAGCWSSSPSCSSSQVVVVTDGIRRRSRAGVQSSA
jgi:hypothetical protein